MSYRTQCLIGVVSGVLMATPATSQQPVAGESSDAALAEVLVTAERRTENLQSVPVAITALGASTLEKLQLEDTLDLDAAVPNLFLAQATANPSNISIGMRGVSQGGGGFATSESPVGFYVDDVYRARMAGTNLEFNDVERVEVLRGPQGTLYGRNSLAGAIKIVTRRPGDDPWRNLTLGFGSFDEAVVKASIGQPIVPDRFAASGAVVYRRADGFIYNRATDEDVGGYENWSARLAGHWYGSESLQAFASAFASRDRNDGYVPTPATYPQTPATSDNLELQGGIFTTQSPTPSRGETDQHGATLDIDYSFGDVRLRSISGLIAVDDLFRADFTGGVALPAGVFISGFDRTATAENRQFSQELQLLGESARLSWIIGAFYFRERIDQEFRDVLGGALALLPTDLHLETDGYALFAQGDYSITPALSLTAGLRWSRDEKSNDATIQTSFSSFTLTPVNVDRSFTSWTPRLGLDHQLTPQVLTYFSASRGFQAGGFNPGALASPSTLAIPYEPQTAWSFEVGVKSELLDNRVRVNASAFWTEYEDLQQLVRVSPTIFTFVTQNAGDARVYGLELEVQAVPISGLTLFGQLGLQSDEYLRLDPLSQAAIAGAQNLNVTPHYSGQIGFDWRQPIGATGSVSLIVGSDLRFTDDYFASSDNTLRTEAYTRWNGFIGVAGTDERWQARVAVRNLLDDEDTICCTTAAAGTFAEAPRRIMAEFSLRY